MRYNSHEEYITSFPLDIQLKLREIQSYIVKQLPSGCEEVISYNMPAFKLKKVVVYFAAHKKHLGFYPTSKPIEEFKEELKPFTFSKGALQFPYKHALPKNLIKKMVEFRLKDLEL
jgi:uncharacterized protein YdhG (YjbR/CyaY superfamily)